MTILFYEHAIKGLYLLKKYYLFFFLFSISKDYADIDQSIIMSQHK